MVQFTKLRLNGFKSFVDRTELEIAPGLNGIVGPNGCGKSNLVEALRWVMGENSAKRMRGDGMEDVIFNGTEKRTQRNIAEVSLLLDNSDRKAPAAYNGSDEIEVIRRIERDHGSNYKINGKNVRMRDVQMLFADTVTGANSPALVSQGRVTQIINSKPLERRLILEESAGISGLFARRHEAELRLRAADTNMLRIEDILNNMEARLSALKKQARQAARYKNMSIQIRELEVLIAYRDWETLNNRLNATRKNFEEAESRVAEKLAMVTQLTKTQTAQSQDIQPMRQQEAEAAAALQTQRLKLQRIEDEAARYTQALEETTTQLTQTEADEQHERQSLNDNSQMLGKLEAEQKIIIEEQKADGDKFSEKQTRRDELENKVLALEEKYASLMQSEAETRARKASLEQQIKINNDRLETVKQRKTKAEEDLKSLSEQDNDAKHFDDLKNKNNALEDKIKVLNEEILKQESLHEKAKKDLQDARQNLAQAEGVYSKFAAELATLESFLNETAQDSFKPILDEITTDTGFEKALSRALGDSLLASLEEEAPARWRTRKKLADMPDLPKGAHALLPHIKAPKELHLALSQIGYVENEAQGHELADTLLPGQALVSRLGTYWRWDGYCIQAKAADRNAQQLEHKNRLKDLQKKAPEHESLLDQTRKSEQQFQLSVNQIEQTLKIKRDELKTAEDDLRKNTQDINILNEKRVRFESETLRLNDTINIAEEDRKTLEEIINWDEERLKGLTEQADAKKAEDMGEIKKLLDEARESHNAAIRAFDAHLQEQNTRKARIQALADERVSLQNRAIRSREHVKALEARRISLTQKLEELKKQPHDFSADQQKLLSMISEMEAHRNTIAEKLSQAENEITDTNRALKEGESLLGQAREARAHAQATFAALQEQINSMEAEIHQHFEMNPAELATHAGISESSEAENEGSESLKQKKEKFIRERDSIGPVNLRADDEAQELEVEVTKLLNERNDLMQAIEELRGGIAKINKEARERLVSAFEHVNAHFQRLFSVLFAGGKAHLALIDSEDPLESGLEIFAQPPGKALQSLSLLSGGEQTLASIALIFAMFLTNPSPICVLDEIDAPLDDANVDRVCTLLENIAERGETRFVIITHHRMTMARMNRLYGVTMAEKGVSQLVSVDLQQSFDFLEAA